MVEINRFYDTPTGQKLIKEMPLLLKESQAIGQRVGTQIALEVLKKLMPELQRRELKLDQKT